MKMDKQGLFLAVFLGVVVVVVLYAIGTALPVLFPAKVHDSGSDALAGQSVQGAQNAMGSRFSRMRLSAFDVELAKQFMDKDSDGKCDVCGMPVELCIDSGQLQCNMDPNSAIGVLVSQHIHADWKVYVDGEPFDFEPFAMDMSKMDSNTTSSFIHVDKGAQPPEKTGDVIHMHATGVPLWLFFRSIGGDFNETCLTLPNNKQFCNSESKKLRFYVNGVQNNGFGDYVFNNLDKILITYSSIDTDIRAELSSITDFAKSH